MTYSGRRRKSIHLHELEYKEIYKYDRNDLNKIRSALEEYLMCLCEIDDKQITKIRGLGS